MKDKYDVIIIGAGIGGLVCACYLSQKGLKVLVVEKNKNVGGCASSFKKNNFTFDMGAHLIGGCDNSGLFTHYLKALNIKVEFIKMNPFDRYIFGGNTVDVPDDLSDFKVFLKREFPKENGMDYIGLFSYPPQCQTLIN